jgi:hypothetical protein
MKTRSRNLAERVMELERRCPNEPSRFYMIWGKDDADCATKLKKAKTDGEIKRGDRFDMKVWTNPAPMPAPRWTSFPQMLEVGEFEVWYDAMPDRSQELEMGASSRALMLLVFHRRPVRLPHRIATLRSLRDSWPAD